MTEKKEVSVKEYRALLDLEEAVRTAMITPGAGRLVAGAIDRIDTVRNMEGIQAAALLKPKKVVQALIGAYDDH